MTILPEEDEDHPPRPEAPMRVPTRTILVVLAMVALVVAFVTGRLTAGQFGDLAADLIEEVPVDDVLEVPVPVEPEQSEDGAEGEPE